MKAKLNKYAWIGLTSARSNLAYIGEVGSRAVFLAIVLYIFLCLWRVTYSETGSSRLAGLSLTQMLWYLAMTETFTLSAPRVAATVDEHVRTGALALYLLKPVSYPLQIMFNTLGERLVRYGLNFIVGATIAFLLVGPLPFTSENLLFFLAALPLAFVVDFLGNFVIGLGAFWLEDTSGLLLLYSRMTMIAGGMLIPIELFPDKIQPLLKMLPFSSIVYGPARLFVAPDLATLESVMINQVAATIGFGILVAIIYGVALRRVFSNGG